MSKPLIYGLLGVLTTIAFIHGFGNYYYWYWEYPWLDTVAHMLGGFWLAGTAIWWAVFSSHGMSPIPGTFSLIALVVIVVFVGGVAWEFVELAIGATSFSVKNYASDTITDMLSDIAGAGLLLFFFGILRKYIR